MSQGTSPTNGRVDSAVLNTKLDHLTTVAHQTDARVEDIRTEQGEMRKDLAVYEERWINHRKEHEKYDKSHGDLHKRERGILGTLILVVGGASTSISTWWANR